MKQKLAATRTGHSAVRRSAASVFLSVFVGIEVAIFEPRP
jgi:hypothetical protein